MITTGQKRKRSILLRQFGEYMQQIDKVAYLYPKRKFKAPARYLPYIFTHSQISAILEYADKDAKEHSSVSSRVDTAIILRLLYGCGLRISEALSLKMQDVDLDNGVIPFSDRTFSVNSGQNTKYFISSKKRWKRICILSIFDMRTYS
jgi:integrase